MRLATSIAAVLAFILAATISLGVAVIGAKSIEQRSTAAVGFAMREEGLHWVTVRADGLQVHLSGLAPDEASRFRALSRAGAVVDADRIRDRLDVIDPDAIVPPRFSLEILRNGAGISLIGLIPTATGRETVARGIERVADGIEVANMVETADFPEPAGWSEALAFGLQALSEMPRAKISVFDGQVEVTAVTESAEEKATLEDFLTRTVPDGVELIMNVSAPRPVITPFVLRYVVAQGAGRFEACSADTEESRERILAAAVNAGLSGERVCDIGLGVPSPNWAEAVETALSAVAAFDAATITFSDADVALVAAAGTSPALFDRVVGELDADLPEVFSLQAVLTETPDQDGEPEGPPSFVATRSPEGYVQLRGRLPDQRVEEAVQSYGMALFGRDNTYLATVTDSDLPERWPLRVLAGLEALAQLHNGSLTVDPDLLSLRGNTGNRDAVSLITRRLSEELGAAENYEIDVAYQESLDPEANRPTGEECLARINEVLSAQKITFETGSAELNDSISDILDTLAEFMPDCQHVEMEIGGHTDNQGREGMNLNLSQARADAVLNGLLARRILTSNLSAQGYGETRPIADNDTEEGRETNRRIEFRLLEDVLAQLADEQAEARAASLADAPRPVPRPDDLAGPDAEEETE